jgi:hypothetical protein
MVPHGFRAGRPGCSALLARHARSLCLPRIAKDGGGGYPCETIGPFYGAEVGEHGFVVAHARDELQISDRMTHQCPSVTVQRT